MTSALSGFFPQGYCKVTKLLHQLSMRNTYHLPIIHRCPNIMLILWWAVDKLWQHHVFGSSARQMQPYLNQFIVKVKRRHSMSMKKWEEKKNSSNNPTRFIRLELWDIYRRGRHKLRQRHKESLTNLLYFACYLLGIGLPQYFLGGPQNYYYVISPAGCFIFKLISIVWKLPS